KTGADTGTLSANRPLVVGRRHGVVIRVSPSGVATRLDDKPVFAWAGRPDQLSVPKMWQVPQSDRLFLGTNSDFAVHRLTLRASGSRPPVEDAARWQQAIKLLPVVEIAKDRVHGTWEKKDGALVSGPEQRARIEIPYIPPAEYDFRIAFTRNS